MLLPIAFCLFVVTTANPFHKYPYVFLLDIGNEELEKSNTEQIRISAPGGSIALRYPAIGDGDTIGHVRVSGIDFGTDLKANIVDGGPGYKYVVLVFVGKPGVAYDAVLTLQTVPNDVDSFIPPNVNYKINSQDGDPNDSSEDFSDGSSSGPSQNTIQKNDAEFTQSSSNVYRYAQDERMYSENRKYEENDDVEDKNDPGDNDYEENNGGDDDDDADDKNSDDEGDQENYGHSNQNEEVDDSKPQKFSDDDDDDYDNDEAPLREPDDSHHNYQNEDGQTFNEVNDETPEIRRLFNNNMHNDEDKYKDSNNNDYIDSEDSFAVAY